jgi:MFS transporter, FHS family, L-fucose permease
LFVLANLLISVLGVNRAPRTLALFAAAAVALVTATIFTGGYVALWAIIAVGLFNSIMFPTIFTLAIDQLGEYTSKGSGVLNTAIVGGAIVPLAMGAMADTMGIQNAFIITLLCYAFIFYYAVWGYKVQHK